MDEPIRTHSEQRLYDKLKQRQIFTTLSGLTGMVCGQLDVKWKNGGTICLNIEGWQRDVLNGVLKNPSYDGTVRYHFADGVTKVEYLTIK